MAREAALVPNAQIPPEDDGKENDALIADPSGPPPDCNSQEHILMEKTYPIVSEKYREAIENCSMRLRGLIYENKCAPVMLRLALCSCRENSLACILTNPGGPCGTQSNFGAYAHEADLTLRNARKLLRPIKKEFPTLSFADFYQLAGIIAVEITGGPEITFNPGREDKPKTSPGKFLHHTDLNSEFCLRDILGYVGLSDQDIVALCGGHSLGKCHKPDGVHHGFGNSYFSGLLKLDLAKELYSTTRTMNFDWIFRSFAEKYEKDENAFLKDYAEAHQKISELGFVSRHLEVGQLPIFYTFISRGSTILAEHMSYVGCLHSIANVKACAINKMRWQRSESYVMIVSGRACKCRLEGHDGYYYFAAGDVDTSNDVLRNFVTKVITAFNIHCLKAAENAEKAESETTFFCAMGQSLLNLVRDFNTRVYDSEAEATGRLVPNEEGIDDPDFVVYCMIARRSTSVILFEYSSWWKPSETFDFSDKCRRRLLQPEQIKAEEVIDDYYTIWGLESNDIAYFIVSSNIICREINGRFYPEELLDELQNAFQGPFYYTQLLNIIHVCNLRNEEYYSLLGFPTWGKKMEDEEWNDLS